MDTPSAALKKLKHFCAYQDRCHQDVIGKLHQLGLWGPDADEILAVLITEDYLNEERYARNFARGKFRMKKWGRRKISQALKRKDVSSYCIGKGLSEIPEAQYQEVLDKLASAKYESLRLEPYLKRKYKTAQYLIAKGYEPDRVAQTLERLRET